MIEQGTDAWKQQRLGKVTASKIADVLAKTKNGWGAQRANYKAALVLERLTGQPQDMFQTAAMLHGIQTEPEACRAYAFHYDAELTESGFVDHPSIAMSGASPDRLCGPAGLIEVKCPQPATHLDTLLSGKVPDKYRLQMLWQMACLPGREWCDFVSYCPTFPEHMRLFVKRVERDAEAIAEIENEVRLFLAEIEDTVGKLLAAYEPQPVKEAA